MARSNLSILYAISVLFSISIWIWRHINQLVPICYYQLRRIQSIRRSLLTDGHQVDKQLCDQKGWLLQQHARRLPGYQTNRIQAVLNDSARVIFDGSWRDHVTPNLCDCLHWVHAPEHIEFKVALLVYKALNKLAPDYIASYCHSGSTNQRQSTLRSADEDDLIVLKTVTEFVKRSFAFAGPRLWNNLPINVRQSPSIDIFKTCLKTFLFHKSFRD